MSMDLIAGRLRGIANRVDTLERQESGIRISSANVSNPPTDAELDTEFGTPANVGAGFVAIVDDAGGGSNVYLVWSDGTYWWHAAGTKAT